MKSAASVLACPLPITRHDTVQLAHGSGGRLSAELIEDIFLPHFGNPALNRLDDQAVLARPDGRIAFSTDSFVVDPIFFPGGDIGELAVNGTVNDVAMSGAIPLYLSVAFVIEEGLAVADLSRIAVSMARAAKIAGVRIVTGDTKVVGRGACDKIFINTSGVGVLPDGVSLGSDRIQPGDRIIVSGTLADHGMAILTTRAGLSFESRIASDTAALNGLIAVMLAAGGEGIRVLRDPTRGGVAASLNEWAKSSQKAMRLFEERLPVRPAVRGACELLGIDPLYVANEGKLLAIVSPDTSDQVLAAMRANSQGRDAVLIGEIIAADHGRVTMRTVLGAERLVDLPLGEQLPRIC